MLLYNYYVYVCVLVYIIICLEHSIRDTLIAQESEGAM